MLVDFGKMTYFDGVNDGRVLVPEVNRVLEFDTDYFQEMINNGNLRDAANYARQYHMNNLDDDRRYYNYIKQIEDEADEIEAKYARVRDNKEIFDKIQFADNVFQDRGLEKLSYDNKYANTFKQLKQEIGGKDATKLSITFQAKKQKFLGLDFLAEDNNDRNIQTLYDKLGMSEADLREVGIKISNDVKTGETTLTFNKAHRLTDKILYNLNYVDNSYQTKPSVYSLVDKLTGFDNFQPKIKGLNNKNEEIYNYDLNDTVTFSHFTAYQKMIKEATEAKEIAFAENEGPKQYNSIVAPIFTDELQSYTMAYQKGELDPKKYYNYRDKIVGGLDEMIRSIGVENYEIYSNINNEEKTDMTQRLLDTIDKQNLQSWLQSIDRSRINYMTQSVNGELGLLITIDPMAKKETNIKDNTAIDKQFKGRSVKIFIPKPDFAIDLINNSIQNNTQFKAKAKINKMQDYDYGYTTTDQNVIQPDGLGGFKKISKINGKKVETPLTKDEATSEIQLDMGIKDYLSITPYQFANRFNMGVLSDEYYTFSKQTALKMVNEIYPNIPLINEFGEPINDIQDLFEVDLNYVPGDVAKKIQKFRDTYNKLYKGYNYQSVSKLS